jgi:predicted transcriptional regulator
MEEIHIGRIIKQKIQEKSVNIGEFADNIHCCRTAVYNIFKQKSIDTELLIKISIVLDYDFIHEIYFPKNNPTSTNWKDFEQSEIINDMMKLSEKIQRVQNSDRFVKKYDTFNNDL